MNLPPPVDTLLPTTSCDVNGGGCGAPAGVACALDCRLGGEPPEDELEEHPDDYATYGDPDEAYDSWRDEQAVVDFGADR